MSVTAICQIFHKSLLIICMKLFTILIYKFIYNILHTCFCTSLVCPHYNTCKPNRTFVLGWAGVLRKIAMCSNVRLFFVTLLIVERCTFRPISGSILLINWHHVDNVDELPCNISSVNDIDVGGWFCKAAIT